MVDLYGYSIATIPCVATMVYGIIEFLKHFFFSGNEKFNKLIPIIAAVLGGVLTIIIYFVAPEFVPTTSLVQAILFGLASGLSAVGVNQIKKQSEKKDGDGGGS